MSEIWQQKQITFECQNYVFSIKNLKLMINLEVEGSYTLF